MNKPQPPRGTYDALPKQSARFRHIEGVAASVFHRFGFGEIRTPVFEMTEVFSRHVGDSTDIVNKEMYTFADRNGESMTLRPEGTAAVVRAYYTNGMKQDLPLKLCYIGTPMFRYERPQKGRYRQFHQIGCEFFGVAEPWADVEVIAAGVTMLKELGIKNTVVTLNSLGTAEDRAIYREKLLAYFEPVKDQLSEDSQDRLYKNPLRILDSKDEKDKRFVADAPYPLDCLGEEATAHFETVKQGLDALGIKYNVNPTIVRGLDYYTHTVFEIHGEGLGAQSQVIGGGRFDKLIEQMGGDPVPAVGFGCGMERLEMMVGELETSESPISIITQNAEMLPQAIKVAQELRDMGKSVDMTLDGKAMAKQFKRANKLGASHVVVIGEDEVANGILTIKNMASGEESKISSSNLAEYNFNH